MSAGANPTLSAGAGGGATAVASCLVVGRQVGASDGVIGVRMNGQPLIGGCFRPACRGLRAKELASAVDVSTPYEPTRLQDRRSPSQRVPSPRASTPPPYQPWSGGMPQDHAGCQRVGVAGRAPSARASALTLGRSLTAASIRKLTTVVASRGSAIPPLAPPGP
jgi:hypothetical protein